MIQLLTTAGDSWPAPLPIAPGAAKIPAPLEYGHEHEARNPPSLSRSQSCLQLRNQLHDPFERGYRGTAHRSLFGLSPILHRQTEDPRYRRPGRQVQPPLRQEILTNRRRNRFATGWQLARRWLWAGVWCFALSQAVFAETPDCEPGRIKAFVEPPLAIDGDTLLITGQRRVRLIGIDAPELSRTVANNEPLAEQARDALAALVAKHKVLALQRGTQPTDNYQRELAHAFLRDGTNVQAWLLRQGLAVHNPIPPNLNYLNCYRDAERSARRQRIGLWALADYQPQPSVGLSVDTGGYHRIRGKVSNVSLAAGGRELHLQGGIAAFIDRDYLQYFDVEWLEQLTGRSVILSGRVFAHDTGLRMLLPHPAQLEFASD
jgi:micrococcal nuclease